MKQHLSHSPSFHQRFSRLAPAFTLVEMLVVITIITVLLTMGAMGLKNMSKASGVGAGLPVAEAIFAEARSMAMGTGRRSRVLIHNEHDSKDKYHRERFLRYMVIAQEKVDKDGNVTAGDWIVVTKGVNLPKGVYFSKELSEKAGVVPELTEQKIKLPGNSESSCFYYEFNAEGLISEPQIQGDDVPSFVIGAGSLPPNATEPIGMGTRVGGFVIWRSGRTSVFRHIKQIDSSLSD